MATAKTPAVRARQAASAAAPAAASPVAAPAVVPPASAGVAAIGRPAASPSPALPAAPTLPARQRPASGGQPPLPAGVPQERPHVVRGGPDQPLLAAVKVDAAIHDGRALQVDGWVVGDATVAVCVGDELPAQTMVRKLRPDVAEATRMQEPAEGFGFVITAPGPRADFGLRFDIRTPGQAQSRRLPLKLERPPTWGPGGKAGAVGFLESAASVSVTGEAAVVGWVVAEAGARTWLQDEQGGMHPLQDVPRLVRPEVMERHGAAFGSPAIQSGFVLRVPGAPPGSTLRLLADKGHGPVVLAEITCTALPLDPVAASRQLFALEVPLGQFADSVRRVHAALLEPLLALDRAGWDAAPVVLRQAGEPPAAPLASIIVPLYGRHDFAEHQLLEFSRDPWLLAHAEVLYVIDDPLLLEPFQAGADRLHRLYGVPFRWVWGGVNRGFSGANNLGAAHARGRLLAFVNSDVLPQAPGWLEHMAAFLDGHRQAGAVGPRLTYADGSIQHAGMAFVHRPELDVWINDHPQMGLDPSLDRHRQPTRVPAVTGACMLVRREDMQRAGGWDTGYLAGDFEDSDLCLQLRALGLDCVYLPHVQLTHLERQSFRGLGGGDWRMRVVVFNAVRHGARWGAQLAAPFEAAAVPASTPPGMQPAVPPVRRTRS